MNAFCPGWCKTDMAGWEKPPRTSAQGADTGVWLATLKEEGVNGKFFSDRKEGDW